MTARQIAYREYLKTDHWKHLRAEVVGRDGFKCVRCGRDRLLQAHHTVYRGRFENSVIDDLITLCRLCHRKEHGMVARKKSTKTPKMVMSVKMANELLSHYESIIKCNGKLPSSSRNRLKRIKKSKTLNADLILRARLALEYKRQWHLNNP